MLFSVEQAFVGRDEIRAIPKTHAWEATLRVAQERFQITCRITLNCLTQSHIHYQLIMSIKSPRMLGLEYRIYSINRPGRVLHFWILRVGAYLRLRAY